MITFISTNYDKFDLSKLKQLVMQLEGRDMSTTNKDRTEPLAVLSQLVGNDETKHFYFTFLIATPPHVTREFVNLFESMRHTWIHDEHRVNTHLITGSLQQWIEVITKYSNDSVDTVVLDVLNRLQNFFEEYGLSQLFRGHSKQAVRNGYYLKRQT